MTISGSAAETKCRVVFPIKGEAASDSVLVIGKQADVKRAKVMLEAMVREQVCTNQA